MRRKGRCGPRFYLSMLVRKRRRGIWKFLFRRSAARAVSLVKLTVADAISSKQAKEVFAAIMDEDADPEAIVEARGMKQVSDTDAIEAVVDEVIAANPDEVARYRDGNDKLIGFFVGQCMKAMRGQGNPKIINELLAKKLG